MSLKKIIAFTLSEVLLVLAIIGVTAALTLPSLNGDLDERKIVAKLRKEYAELKSIHEAIVQTYGSPYEWNVASTTNSTVMTNTYTNYFKEMAKISKECSINNTDCLFFKRAGYPTFLMKDGTSVAIWLKGKESMDGKYLGEIYVDVDAHNGDSTTGYDEFGFHITRDGIEPFGDDATPSLDIDYSTAWVIHAGNIDYLNCDNLNWNTKRTCK